MARTSRFRSKKGYKEGLQKRTEQATGSRGGKWKPIFLSTAKFEKWTCKEGDHVIDIIPYLDDDDIFQYKLEVLVHQRIGPDEGNYICPKTFDSKANCALCDLRSMAQAEDNEAMADLLRPRERVIYNIVCYDNNKEEDKGVQVWEASGYLAEDNFQAAAKKRQKGGVSSKISFADPDDGRTISFERTGSGVGTRYIGFVMEERDEPISDDILDEAYILEDLIDIPSDEVLQEQADIVLGSFRSNEEDEQPEDSDKKDKSSKTSSRMSRRSKGRGKKDEKDEKNEEKEEKSKSSRRRTRRTIDKTGDSGTGDDVPMDLGKDEDKEAEDKEKSSDRKRSGRRRVTRRR